MREIRTSGSVRGASGNGRPYRERTPAAAAAHRPGRICPLAATLAASPFACTSPKLYPFPHGLGDFCYHPKIPFYLVNKEIDDAG